MDIRKTLLDFARRKDVQLAGAVLGGASVGAYFGYIFAYEKASEEYKKIVDTELQEAKEYYTKFHKTGEYADPVELAKDYIQEENVEDYDEEVQDAIKALKDYSPENPAEENPEKQSEIEKAEVVESIQKNVFDTVPENEAEFDYQAEHDKRIHGKPFIVTQEQFFENELEHEQITITYFEGDDVLSDEQDKPVENVDKIVGNDNLDKFGYGSNDPNVVYVRNDDLHLDFEIIHSDGKYTEEVLGFIEHSDRPRIRKFKVRDD